MSDPSLLNMTAPCREDFKIPYHEIGPASQKLSLAMVAGVRGNAINGVFILARLADYLRAVEAGKYPGISLNKRVIIVPSVNVLGLNLRMRLWPFDKTDINRMFPGYDRGETTQRIAAAVLKATHGAENRVEVHSSNLDIEEMPHLRTYDPNPEERALAEKFGLPVIEKKLGPVLSVSLVRAWKQYPGTSLVLRGGKAGELQIEQCEKLFRSILRFLSSIQVTSGHIPGDDEEESHYFGPKQGFRLISEHAGFFVSKMDPGRWVRAGDLLGVLYDGYTGTVRKEIFSPKSGLLLALRRQALCFQGDLLARLLLKA